jgi:hypothetical protein
MDKLTSLAEIEIELEHSESVNKSWYLIELLHLAGHRAFSIQQRPAIFFFGWFHFCMTIATDAAWPDSMKGYYQKYGRTSNPTVNSQVLPGQRFLQMDELRDSYSKREPEASE